MRVEEGGGQRRETPVESAAASDVDKRKVLIPPSSIKTLETVEPTYPSALPNE